MATVHPIRELCVPIVVALSRARLAILTIVLTYAVSLGTGMVMAHNENAFALDYRDNLVGAARTSDPSSLALQRGERWNAALIDFGRNLLAAAADTIGGLGIVLPYAFVAYRGWVGGIVSVDGAHVSRLVDPAKALYYLSVVLLQLTPYSLCAGAGINLGLAYYRPRPHYKGAKWLGLPREAIRDVLRIYVIAIPLFFVASLVEFLAA